MATYCMSAISRRLVAEGRFVAKVVTGKGAVRRIRRGIGQTGGRGAALFLQVTDPHRVTESRLAIQRAVAQGQLPFVLLETSYGTPAGSSGAWGEANEW